MKRILVGLMAALAVLLLGACETKRDTGALIGGAAGAVAGSQVGEGRGQTLATIVGAIGGAVLGRELGDRLDERDREKIAESLETEQTGETTVWRDPDTGEEYSLTPVETFEEEGRPCRRFEMAVEGVEDEVTGVACRESNGVWRIVG